MQRFPTMHLPSTPDTVAPDGSDVRVLLALPAGNMAHFQLAPDEVSTAVAHHTVDEIWYVLSGTGEMWRSQADREETVALASGTCLTIPCGTHFQFRALGSEPLCALGVAMPPWPGDGEAYKVRGTWTPTVPR